MQIDGEYKVSVENLLTASYSSNPPYLSAAILYACCQKFKFFGGFRFRRRSGVVGRCCLDACVNTITSTQYIFLFTSQ